MLVSPAFLTGILQCPSTSLPQCKSFNLASSGLFKGTRDRKLVNKANVIRLFCVQLVTSLSFICSGESWIQKGVTFKDTQFACLGLKHSINPWRTECPKELAQEEKGINTLLQAWHRRAFLQPASSSPSFSVSPKVATTEAKTQPLGKNFVLLSRFQKTSMKPKDNQCPWVRGSDQFSQPQKSRQQLG